MVKIAIVIVIGSLLIGVGSAAAQPGATPPSGGPPAPGGPYGQPLYAPPPPPPAPVAQGELKSEGTALALSLGGTVLAWGLAVGLPLLETQPVDFEEGSSNRGAINALSTIGAIGTLVAPSFGHWYAGKYFTRGMGMRVGALGLVMVGAVVALAECPLTFGHDDVEDDDCDDSFGAATFILLGGAALFVAGTVDDIRTAPRRVRRHNEAISSIALAPIVTHQSAGLALGGRF